MRQVISNFSRGEFGPQLYGRVDVPQYSAGAKKLTNFPPQRYGGVAFRPGFRYVYELSTEINQRLVPFQYSNEQAYMLTMADEEMYVTALGAMVIEDNLKITAATNAAQGVFTVALHAYVVGDPVFLSGLTGAWAVLNGKTATVVAVPGADQVTLDVDTSSLGAFTSSDGTTRVSPPAAPEPPEPPLPPPPPAPEPPHTGTPPDWKLERGEGH
jgi:hypothetical protein